MYLQMIIVKNDNFSFLKNTHELPPVKLSTIYYLTVEPVFLSSLLRPHQGFTWLTVAQAVSKASWY